MLRTISSAFATDDGRVLVRIHDTEIANIYASCGDPELLDALAECCVAAATELRDRKERAYRESIGAAAPEVEFPETASTN